MRPAEVNVLQGDASKAHRLLDWSPSYTFEDMIQEMVNEDLKQLGQEHP